MGCCCSSRISTSSEVTGENPDIERRRYEAEKATEGRRTANELRGIKEINKVRKPQNRSKEEQKREIEAAKNSTNERILRWLQD